MPLIRGIWCDAQFDPNVWMLAGESRELIAHNLRFGSESAA
jgi:hypothetical protein